MYMNGQAWSIEPRISHSREVIVVKEQQSDRAESRKRVKSAKGEVPDNDHSIL